MKYIIFALIFALGGCSTTAYEQYAKSTEAASVARSNALASIAAKGDSAAGVAAVMALALGNQNTLQAPPQNEALQWASILVPGVTQVMGMRYNYLSQQTASNNAMAVAVSTNNTMQGIAGQIQAPGAITTNTLSGTGTLGSGAYTTTDNHTTTPASVVIAPVVPITPVVVVPPVVVTPVVTDVGVGP